jgi:hypothetical protein
MFRQYLPLLVCRENRRQTEGTHPSRLLKETQRTTTLDGADFRNTLDAETHTHELALRGIRLGVERRTP